MCKVYTKNHATSEIEHGSFACTVDNSQAKARGVSLRSGGQTMLHLSLKVADPNFGCATFCALPSIGAVTTSSSHTTVSSHKVSVKDSDIVMCSAIYFLFDHNTKYCTNYLCPHTVVATV